MPERNQVITVHELGLSEIPPCCFRYLGGDCVLPNGFGALATYPAFRTWGQPLRAAVGGSRWQVGPGLGGAWVLGWGRVEALWGAALPLPLAAAGPTESRDGGSMQPPLSASLEGWKGDPGPGDGS